MEYSRSLQFHGHLYEVTCIVRDGARNELSELGAPPGSEEAELIVDVECEDGQRWSGSFTADYVESLTSKTGNYKKLSVFARMLAGALDGSADSVYVDLLTAGDLEALRERKRGRASPGGAAVSPGASRAPAERRYLIVTYAVEFDRVLMVGGDNVVIGTPLVEGGKVTAEVVSHGRHEKVKIVKFNRRKHRRKETGHRQWFTEVKITGISA